MRLRLFLPCLLALAGCWTSSAWAQMQRCTGADGTLVYTDRKCEDIGAVERLPRGTVPAASGVGSISRSRCPRTLQELVYELTSAIDARDVNRIAGVYHWVGMPTRAAYGVMQRLDGIVNRPLVDVLPIYPRPPPVLAEDGSVLDPNADGYYPQPSSNRPPVALRLEQTLGRSATPSRTVFGLRRHLGCWWVSL